MNATILKKHESPRDLYNKSKMNTCKSLKLCGSSRQLSQQQYSHKKPGCGCLNNVQKYSEDSSSPQQERKFQLTDKICSETPFDTYFHLYGNGTACASKTENERIEFQFENQSERLCGLDSQFMDYPKNIPKHVLKSSYPSDMGCINPVLRYRACEPKNTHISTSYDQFRSAFMKQYDISKRTQIRLGDIQTIFRDTEQTLVPASRNDCSVGMPTATSSRFRIKDVYDTRIHKLENDYGCPPEEERSNNDQKNDVAHNIKYDAQTNNYDHCISNYFCPHLHLTSAPEKFNKFLEESKEKSQSMNLCQNNDHQMITNVNTDSISHPESGLEESLISGSSANFKNGSSDGKQYFTENTNNSKIRNSSVHTHRSRQSVMKRKDFDDLVNLERSKCNVISVIDDGLHRLEHSRTENEFFLKPEKSQSLNAGSYHSHKSHVKEKLAKNLDIIRSDFIDNIFKEYRGYHLENMKQEIKRIQYLDSLPEKWVKDRSSSAV